MTQPQTEAGRALLGYLNGDESGLVLIGVHPADAIIAIEQEAVAAALVRLVREFDLRMLMTNGDADRSLHESIAALTSTEPES